jgi:p-cumate 2,3-dioxygenase ferredoxin reductase subunit
VPTESIGSIVIAGAGQAGGRAAEALRASGYRGAVTMIGEEAHPPYERPQLSKQLLMKSGYEVVYLKPVNEWSSVLDINVITGAAVVACDADKQTVATTGGDTVAYDRLLIATGTQPRRIKGIDGTSARIQYLRSIEDALQLRKSLEVGARVVVLGGGVIGLEAASAAAKRNCDVTVVESGSRLLARAFPKIVSDFVENVHRAHGVKFVFGTTVTEGVPHGVRLSDGQQLAADVLLVGIGVEPVASIAQGIGLSAQAGIEVDAFGQTAVKNIFSAGDVALQWSECHGRNMRIETWANAQNQAACVAANMIGIERAYRDPAWFWSDQYGLNIQVVGDPTSDDLIIRGDITTGRFSVIALRDGTVAGAVAVNAAKDMAMLRRLAGRPVVVERSELESPAYDLRKALKNRTGEETR